MQVFYRIIVFAIYKVTTQFTKKDFQAVRNAIRLNITNGMTEGFVNKLKVVKRCMFGRAGLELLKNKLVFEHILFN